MAFENYISNCKWCSKLEYSEFGVFSFISPSREERSRDRLLSVDFFEFQEILILFTKFPWT